MDGPSGKKTQNSNQKNMSGLVLKDLAILKMFLEKGLRANIFLSTEKKSVTIIHTKLSNIINTVIDKIQSDQIKSQVEI